GRGAGLKVSFLAGQVREDGLGDFLGEFRGADLAKRGRINKTEVAADQFGEGLVGVLASVAGEQLQVGVAHVQESIAAGCGDPTRFVEPAWNDTLYAEGRRWIASAEA